ncbi:FOG: PKD repeat [uncultured Coleofasciculus sp.]|uniref:FOG: PKD repeat n=1 Tax=uncultured Coleofasciculus sp. TaxID=1267456 RepID=A0A6J4HQK3_9CYAN|nr:FOG: PKD repeat [uncultured Coleofasciculus sp.]
MSQNTPVSFSDISSSYWARDFITQLAARDIIAGFPDGRFRPNEPVTRAQFAAMIRKAFNKNKVRNAISFRDISSNYWASSHIREAYEMGFLDNVSGDEFSPNRRLSRQDILVALTKGLDYSLSGSSESILQLYSDVATIPSEVRSVVAAATQRGLVVSYPNTKSLNLNAVATRAEVAAFIHQALVSTGQASAITSPYVIGSTLASNQTEVTTQTTTSGRVTQTGGTTNTRTETGSSTNTTTQTTGSDNTTTQTTGSDNTTTQTTGGSGSSVTLTNGYKVSFLGVTYNDSANTSTWRYYVEELPEAQDLSNWVLEVPSCTRVVSASPKGEIVNPDPNAKLSGIKWQPGGGFEQGEFSVTLEGKWTVGSINVAVKGPDVASGVVGGCSCTKR